MPPSTALIVDAPAERHAPRPLLWLHWLVAFSLAVTVGALWWRGALPSGHPWRPVLRQVHLQCGVLIWGMMALRLWVRWRYPLPRLASLPRWSTWGGMGAHAVLYAVLLAQPLLGVLFLQAGDKTVTVLGWRLPTLVGSDAEWHANLKDAHLMMGQVFYVLVAMHVGAALLHHHVWRTPVLHRMLPLLRNPAARADSDAEPVSSGADSNPGGAPAPQPPGQVPTANPPHARATRAPQDATLP